MLPWKLDGDLRLRYESDTGRQSQLNRERVRLRLRLGLRGSLSEDWSAGFRVRTGDPQTPYSGNAALFNSLGEKETFGFNLDQAYVRYHPKSGLQVRIGKSAEFCSNATPYDTLMWANDYSPLGIWVGYNQPEWGIRAGYFTLKSQPRYVGAELYAIDADWKVQLSESSELVFDAGYYRFAMDAPVDPFRNRGNSVIRGPYGEAFRSSFQLLESQLTYRFKADDLPVAFSVYSLHNFGAVDSAYALSFGAIVGETRRPGDWSAFCRYQTVGQDSVFSPIAQDDFPLATNFRGVSAGSSYQFDETWRLDCWFLSAARIQPESQTQYRYRLDWNARF